MAGSARSETAAWLPSRPDQAPLGGAGPQFSPAARSGFATTSERRQTRPFRFGSEIEADPDPPLQPGARIGERHRVVRLLGEGGMGRVYEAEHVVLARKVAIKLLRGDAQASADSLARFQQEALTASRIGAPQIVEVLDFASHVGAGGRAQTYMVMELLVGESLEDWLDRPGTLDEGVALLAELCDGLAAAHQAGVVHRDIKPANVFVRQPGAREAQPVRVKILDFGIAKVMAGAGESGFQTQKGSLLGTPYYLAPERVLGETLTAAADVYSVGVILYEMLTGDVPFVAESFMGVLARHVQTLALDPRQAAPERGIPDRVAALCMRLLAKQASARGSAHEVALELRGLLLDEGRALAGVRTGPRLAPAPANADTQVLGEPGIHERPTAPPMTGAMQVAPTSWASATGPSLAGPSLAVEVPPPARLARRRVIFGSLGVVALVIASFALVAQAVSEAPASGDPIEVAAEPVAGEALANQPVEPSPVGPASAGVDPPSSASEPLAAPLEGAGLAPAGEASSLAPTEPTAKPSSPAPNKRTSPSKAKPVAAEPEPEPEPEPQPPKPKPIEDDRVPTIKDDIYD